MIFSNFTENWNPKSLGPCPKPHSVSVVDSGWEPQSLCSFWDFMGGNKPCSWSGTSTWRRGARHRWPQNPNCSQEKLPGPWGGCFGFLFLFVPSSTSLETNRYLPFLIFPKSQSILCLIFGTLASNLLFYFDYLKSERIWLWHYWVSYF